MLKEKKFGTEAEVSHRKRKAMPKAQIFFSLPSNFVLFCFCYSVPKVKSSKLCSISPCCFVLQITLYSIKEEGGCKIGAYTSRVGLNLEAVKMRVEHGKKLRIKGEIHILY